MKVYTHLVSKTNQTREKKNDEVLSYNITYEQNLASYNVFLYTVKRSKILLHFIKKMKILECKYGRERTYF